MTNKTGLFSIAGTAFGSTSCEIKARLKSPESMVTKLGKDLEGEAYDIRDILAITFILKDKDDTLKLFHALQKKGVILQENTSFSFHNPNPVRYSGKHDRSGAKIDDQSFTKCRVMKKHPLNRNCLPMRRRSMKH